MEGQTDSLLATLEDISSARTRYYLHFNSNVAIYFKHLNHFELLSIRNDYKNNLNVAQQNGISLEQEQIKIAYDNGWWSKEKEKDLDLTNLSVDRLKKTKLKLVYESDRSRISEQIITQEKRAKKLKEEKDSYIVMTAEGWAGRKTIDYFLQNFLYKDELLKFNFFDDINQFEVAEDSLIDELTVYYYKFLMEFSDKKIKQLAISSFFQNIIYISNCTAWDVFGIPTVKLTKNQSDLLILGKYYQNIIKNSSGEIPDSVFEDPDKITEWFQMDKKQKNTASASRNKLNNKTGTDNSSSFLFGNREEVRAIGGGEISGDKIIHESKQKGGLGIYDLINK